MVVVQVRVWSDRSSRETHNHARGCRERSVDSQVRATNDVINVIQDRYAAETFS